MTAKLTAARLTAYVFYTFAGIWALGVVAGMLFNFTYVSREYRGVTQPLYCALGISVLTLCNLVSGSIWRGGHPPVRRQDNPILYWLLIAVLGGAAAALLVVGVTNWRRLP